MGVTVKSRFRISADEAIKQLRPKAFDRVLADAQGRVRFMRCNEHGTGASLALEGREGESASLKISGCCEAFRQEVLQAIRRK
jgi:hypothetical protein